MGLMALLALPLYLVLAVVLIPVGIGLLMVFGPIPPMYLFPFIFTGTKQGLSIFYHLSPAVSVPLSVMQWAGIAWLFGRQAGHWTRARTLRRAAGLLVGVMIVTAVVLQIFGLSIVTTSPRM